jgi:hypothetical protein
MSAFDDLRAKMNGHQPRKPGAALPLRGSTTKFLDMKLWVTGMEDTVSEKTGNPVMVSRGFVADSGKEFVWTAGGVIREDLLLIKEQAEALDEAGDDSAWPVEVTPVNVSTTNVPIYHIKPE